jgi:hypothetical protein
LALSSTYYGLIPRWYFFTMAIKGEGILRRGMSKLQYIKPHIEKESQPNYMDQSIRRPTEISREQNLVGYRKKRSTKESRKRKVDLADLTEEVNGPSVILVAQQG